ncbi:MAG: hypothetical protein JNK14_04815 [Chitinophagaceae bacterium]|nr:hypothetical protein [Chitinophagaceae bacterium]
MRLKNTRIWQMALLVAAIPAVMISCDKQPVGPTEPDPVPPPAPGTYMTFTDFRALHGGTGDVTVPAGTKKIRGVVISNSANEAAGNYRLQDESGSGLYLYSVVGSPIYSLGSVLEIDAAGAGILTLYNGDLELKSVPQAKVVPIAGSLTVSPRETTIAQIIANRSTWASSLVKVNNLTSIVQGTTNSTGTNYTVTDATGSLSLFVRTVSGITVNTAGTSITGYVSIFNSTTQIGIRSAADIQ